MNIVPIVFCFDDNWELAAGVCITSLLENACSSTFYDIFILYSDLSTFQNNGHLDRLQTHYSNCKITFRCVGESFHGAFQIRGIGISTYYRLLIPEIIPEYDKIMYHDVDVIFRMDLFSLFNSIDISGYYLAGVNSPGGLNPIIRQKREKLGIGWKEYILAGNMIMNSKLLRKDGIVEQFKKEVANSAYEFQDMDIINIVCKGKIKRIPPVFCVTIEITRLAVNGTSQELYTREELAEALQSGIIHYNGPKPWKDLCPNFDYWWEYYRKSIFFDNEFYFNFYQSKMNFLDSLSLIKRIKILLRYFFKGNK